MNIGIHENVPFEDYLAWEALSNTAMGALKKSPRHFRYAEPLESTKALRIGSLGHTGRLEPLELAKRYAVMPQYNLHEDNKTSTGQQSQSWSTGYCKAKAREWTEANQDKQIVSKDEYDEMVGIVNSLCQDGVAESLFNQSGPVELSLLWQDSETGILCKARIDKVCQAGLVDLKTTRDLEAFPRSIARYGYYRQLAHYSAGYEALTGEQRPSWICAVESSSPYCVQTAPLDVEAINEGMAERRRLLRLLADCLEKDHWPGPPNPSAWRLPEWAIDRGPVELTVGGEIVEV